MFAQSNSTQKGLIARCVVEYTYGQVVEGRDKRQLNLHHRAMRTDIRSTWVVVACGQIVAPIRIWYLYISHY